MKTIFPVEFIYEGERYKFTATKSSEDKYTLFLNGSRCVVGARSLSDGGLLCALDGKSHSVYWKEEASATRLSVDGKTCLLEVENDPTQLRTPSPVNWSSIWLIVVNMLMLVNHTLKSKL